MTAETGQSDNQGPSGGAANALQRIMAAVKDQSHPPVHLWNPEFCGDIDMRIARDGTWFYMGTPIGRMRMVKLFASVLRHDMDDKYYLVTPVEKIGITVDDAPFLAVEVTRHGEGREQTLSFRSNVDDLVVADEDFPIRVVEDPETREPSPYILMRDRLEALIGRSVFYELVEMAEEDDEGRLGVWSSGRFFILGRPS